MRDETQLTHEAEVRVQTEPGEITRGFPFETRAFRRDIEVDRVKSYFDLAPPEEPNPDPEREDEDDVVQGAEPQLDELIAAGEAEESEDEPLVATA